MYVVLSVKLSSIFNAFKLQKMNRLKARTRKVLSHLKLHFIRQNCEMRNCTEIETLN